MNAQQIEWAAGHDWFGGWEYLNEFSTDYVVLAQADDGSWLTFDDFEALVAWAGY
jgi:hypothetical protein